MACFFIKKHDDLGGKSFWCFVCFQQAIQYCMFYSTKNSPPYYLPQLFSSLFLPHASPGKPPCHQTLNRSRQTYTASCVVQDRTKMIEQFDKELVVHREFKLESGNIVMIRHLHVFKCTVPLLCQIWVRFKVSGYKNQSKENTLGLLKNLAACESLKKCMNDESASCFSELSSQENEEEARVLDPSPPKHNHDINKKSSAGEKKRIFIVTRTRQIMTILQKTTAVKRNITMLNKKNCVLVQKTMTTQEHLTLGVIRR